MLILDRKVNQRIRINDDIIITVTEMRGSRVSLGFDAPPNVIIKREEIYDDQQDRDRHPGGGPAHPGQSGEGH